jgi:hypothetical protein
MLKKSLLAEYQLHFVESDEGVKHLPKMIKEQLK